jgi:hypothetical protein
VPKRLVRRSARTIPANWRTTAAAADPNVSEEPHDHPTHHPARALPLLREQGPEALFRCMERVERRPYERLRIVLSPAMVAALATSENERRAAQASQWYRPPAPIDVTAIDPAEVRIFGLPIRVDDAATEPAVEIVEEGP